MATTKMVREEFTVRGSYPFPFDMLRYDECFPASESDAGRISQCTHDPNVVVEVRLAHYCESKRRESITAKRWESFCWRVVPDSTDRREF